MRYSVKLVYMDGKDLEITIAVGNIEKFMAAIGNAEVYFDSEKDVGVWIPIDKIRYFTINKV